MSRTEGGGCKSGYRNRAFHRLLRHATLSAGRVLLGVGSGWNREEMRNHGVEPTGRTARMVESVQAMRQIWATDESEFHGGHVDFAPLWSWPKPAQRHGPPVLFGGNGPGMEDQVLAHGDGWLPQAGPFGSIEDVGTRIGRLRERASEAGRGHVPVTMFGTPDDLRLLEQLAAAGVDRCLIPVRSGDPDELWTRLDALTAVREAFVLS